MNWQPELDELGRREAFARQLGGEMRVQRQRDGGRLNVRERIAALVDEGSFHEIGAIAGLASYDGRNDLEHLLPSNFVFGRARLDGRPVVVGGDDFTVRGGSADATIKEKHIMCERMANQLRLPLVRMVEGSGGGGSVKTIETEGRSNVPGVKGWEWVVENMGTVPRVALGLGSVAGLGAAHLAAAHFSVLVKERAALFVAGPPVVERLGETLDKQELGGWKIHARNGAIDYAADSEEHAFDLAKPVPLLPALLHRQPCRTRARRPTIPTGARSGCWRPCRATGARSIACAPSSRRWWTGAAFSSSGGNGAGRSPPASRGSTAGPRR